MWNESDDAVGELLRSTVLRGGGRFDDSVVISGWWAKHGITIAPIELNRNSLFSIATRYREANEPDWVSFLWHVLAWGAMGDFRNIPRIVGSVDSAERHAELNALLAGASEASFAGNCASAYRMFYGKIPRLGPAFFSKFLYFTSDRNSVNPSPLILDSRVSSALFTLIGSNYSRQDSDTYGKFCSDLHRWSNDFDTPADVIEFRLYQFGQLIDSSRWKWLHAEASLYREGRPQVGFDEIAEEMVRRANGMDQRGENR
ncbi:MAG: hypothetical protein WAW85_02955 [Gordonia sp. (in: high G+C Gram-positive bacteria)]|uniref:8-oxoguanine DNA glycosylase OGG fold protein n=1 Tax=Gordonia sp. (in: high G+C Gram-positive bacteria) TaxID=84139 RepID=UPI003BB585FE